MRKNACIREPQTVYKKFTSCTLSEARKKFTETYKHNPQPSSVNTWETKKKKSSTGNIQSFQSEQIKSEHRLREKLRVSKSSKKFHCASIGAARKKECVCAEKWENRDRVCELRSRVREKCINSRARSAARSRSLLVWARNWRSWLFISSRTLLLKGW